MTSPSMLTSGPPELPRLIGASVWMNDSYSLIPHVVALERRDDARGDALAELERRTDRHDQLADLELAAVALGQRRVARVVDLDHGHVRLLVGADHRRLGFDAVIEGHGDLLGIFDDVVVGQDVTVVVVDETRPDPMAPDAELLLLGSSAIIGIEELPAACLRSPSGGCFRPDCEDCRESGSETGGS